MKKAIFLGDSLACVCAFPVSARRDAGYAIGEVQKGNRPADSKPMPMIGPGVEEIRIWGDAGTYRVVYAARMPEAVYVLHAFKKTSQRTTTRDTELARKRFLMVRRFDA